MNKELINKIRGCGFDGVTNADCADLNEETAQEIISLCADEAIDAVNDGVISDPFLSIQYTRNSERYSVIRAIEKRMK